MNAYIENNDISWKDFESMLKESGLNESGCVSYRGPEDEWKAGTVDLRREIVIKSGQGYEGAFWAHPVLDDRGELELMTSARLVSDKRGAVGPCDFTGFLYSSLGVLPSGYCRQSKYLPRKGL